MIQSNSLQEISNKNKELEEKLRSQTSLLKVPAQEAEKAGL